MFVLTRPSELAIERFLTKCRAQDLSYPEVGMTLRETPGKYTVDRNSILLGRGSGVFERAVDALCKWKMFNLGWVSVFQPDTPLASVKS